MRNWPIPFFAAARREATGVRLTELLLAHGADPNARDGTGATPLAHAVQRVATASALDLVLILVGRGADVNARDHTGRSIAAIAASTGNEAMLPLLGPASSFRVSGPASPS